MEMHKKRIGKAAAVLVAILLVCTVASRSIHTLLLPQVSALRVQSGSIRYSEVFTGVIMPQAAEGAETQAEPEQAVVAFRLPLEDAKKVLRTSVTLSCSYSTLAGEDIFVLQTWQSPASILAAKYDAASGMYEIQAAIQPEQAVAAGTPAQVTAVSQSVEYGALVPLGCVMRDAQGGAYVMILEETNDIWGLSTRVRRCEVAVLESNEQYAAIEGSVPRGARLAAYPARTLRDGEEVRVVEAV